MGWFGKKRATEPPPPAPNPMDAFMAKMQAFVDAKVDALGTFACTHCGEDHVALELAFQWPDVAVRVGADEPGDRIALDGRTYLRGTLRVPIRDSGRDFAVG